MFSKDSSVRHRKHGPGVVLADLGDSILVRFETEIQSCLPQDLEPVMDVYESIKQGHLDPLGKMLPHLQAMCIKSVNDQWGVFARSKIERPLPSDDSRRCRFRENNRGGADPLVNVCRQKAEEASNTRPRLACHAMAGANEGHVRYQGACIFA